MTALLHRLANGVRIVVDPMAGIESVSLGVWFRAGAIDESGEEHGVAHLLEHMAFKGTTTRSARQIAEEIEAVGGYLNASTGYLRTGYYARVLKDEVDRAAEILADIVSNPVFDEGELAKERDVVVQEIGEAADAPDDVVMEMLQAQNYRGHALGRPILGTEDSVRSHTRARLYDYMSRTYAAGGLIFGAAGAVDPDRIMRLAEAHFGARAAASPPDRSPSPSYKGGDAHDARDIEQTHIALGFPGAAVRDADYFATRVFVEALGGGMSSRIFQSVREERGLAYSVYAFADSYDETGAVGAYVGADSEHAAEAVGLIRAEIAAMAEQPTQAEIDRARTLLKATMLMGLESPATRAETAAGQLFAHGRLLPPAEIKARIDAVTREDVRAVAAKALAAAAPSLAIVGPADAAAVHAALVGAR
jgi:predicted Zn-dependent peptidase